MKLYTEEQVREAFDNGYKYASTLRPTALEEHYKYLENSIKSLNPIELPSDEEIEEEFKFNDESYYIFSEGAKYMKELIIKKANEK